MLALPTEILFSVANCSNSTLVTTFWNKTDVSSFPLSRKDSICSTTSSCTSALTFSPSNVSNTEAMSSFSYPFCNIEPIIAFNATSTFVPSRSIPSNTATASLFFAETSFTS